MSEMSMLLVFPLICILKILSGIKHDVQALNGSSQPHRFCFIVN